METAPNYNAIKNAVTIARKAIDHLMNGEYDKVGELFDLAWTEKQQYTAGVATPAIKYMYQRGVMAGALGGKVCGAGGGGYMLFYCPAGTHELVRAALSNYKELPFKFYGKGSYIVYNDNNSNHF